MDINHSSLTFLEACDKIVLYSGVDKKVIEANWPDVVEMLAVILTTDFRDVEPYLADGVIELKSSLMKVMGLTYEDLNGISRAKV